MDKSVTFLSLNICYVIYVLLWITYWLMWFESLLVFILFKFKNVPKFPEFGLYYFNILKPYSSFLGSTDLNVFNYSQIILTSIELVTNVNRSLSHSRTGSVWFRMSHSGYFCELLHWEKSDSVICSCILHWHVFLQLWPVLYTKLLHGFQRLESIF